MSLTLNSIQRNDLEVVRKVRLLSGQRDVTREGRKFRPILCFQSQRDYCHTTCEHMAYGGSSQLTMQDVEQVGQGRWFSRQ